MDPALKKILASYDDKAPLAEAYTIPLPGTPTRALPNSNARMSSRAPGKRPAGSTRWKSRANT